MESQLNQYKDDDIAIIGMSGVFPNSNNLDEFWDNLVNGIDSIREFPISRKDELKKVITDVYEKDFMKSGYVGQVAQFEPEIFAISQEEARLIDPQQRLLIELVEEAILDAGYAPNNLSGQNVGLYFSSNLNSYTDKISIDSAMKSINSIPSMSAGRIAYIYNFNGPALNFDSACSSSLVAFHYAVQSLKLEEAEIAIAGGTNLIILPEEKKDIGKQTVLSAEQKVRSFDKNADGTVAGEGGGIIILKLLKKALEDGDNIYAVVKGSSVNSNGNRANGVAAPSERGQAEVILRSIRNAQIEPMSLSYIETHGTGTKVGDPIEVAAITNALDSLGYRRQSVAIGSVKTNIGHLDSAAGIASLIKSILSLKNKKIPASINFESPNPLIDFENSPVYVNDVLSDWKVDSARRVGVTSLGMIGTNVFTILEEPPVRTTESVANHNNLIMISARTQESLNLIANSLLNYLESNMEIPIDDIAFTLNTGRRKFSNNIAISVKNTEELVKGLREFLDRKDKQVIIINKANNIPLSAIFIIPDIGEADLHLINQMYETHPQFKRRIDECKERITNKADLKDPKVMYLINMYAYAKLAEAYSIPVKAVLGIGIGDIIADLIMKKQTIEEALIRVKEYDQPTKVIEEEKMKILGDKIIKSGINTFVTFCFKKETIAVLDKLFGQVPSVILLNLNSETNSFTDALMGLIKKNMEIDWFKVYECEKRSRVSLPGYVFTKKEYFIKPGELVLMDSGKIDVEMEEFSEHKDLSVKERLLHMFEEVYNGQGFTMNDMTTNLDIDSIMIMQFAGKVKKVYGVDVPLSLFFENKKLDEVFNNLEDIVGSRKSGDNLIKRLEDKEFYHASPPQKRIFVLNQLGTNNTSYNMPGAMIIKGNLDRVAFQKAFNKLIERHESLRTTFDFVDDTLVQRIHPSLEIEIEHLTVEEASIPKVIDDFIKPFNLNKLPLLRVSIIQIEPEKSLFLFDIHHIVSDGLSMGILIEELIQLYEGFELPELKIQYRDFAAWQAELFETEDFLKQEKYWLSVFSDEIPALALPTDFQRPGVQSFEGNSYKFKAGKELTEKLFKVTSQEGITLNMFLLAAYNVLMYKYTGQEDIIVGSPISGRRHEDLDGIIGMFVNTLAIRNYPTGNKTFKSFLDEVKEHATKAIDNQDYQFEDLIEKLNLPRDQSRNPLFDTMFVLQNMHNGEAETGSLKFEPYPLGSKVSKFDLNMTASNNETEIYFDLEYCTKLFKEESIKRMSDHFLTILERVVENLQVTLDDIDMLSVKQKSILLHNFNNTEISYEKVKTIHELFEEQAIQNPNRVALVFKDKQLSYGELNEKANKLALELRNRGVYRESIVGLMVDRSLEMIIGLMGILKSGAAYLPIDPQYPDERIEYMLEDSQAKILVTQSSIIDRLSNFQGETIDLYQADLWSRKEEDIQNINAPTDMIYMLYTSGSTGKPKGVMIEHKAVNNFINGVTQVIDFSPDKTLLCLTTISFDIFVLETLLPLTKGLKVVIATENEQVDAKLLGQLIVENQVEMLQATPSRLQMLLSDSEGIECLQNLKEIMVGGEAFTEALLLRLQKLNGTRVYNMYGPTETTVWSTIKEMTNEDSISIGKPIANTRLYIVDKNNNLQPIGVPGELCIAGESLARGYWNKPEMTAEKFVTNPFEVGLTMYKTGDTARWLSNGNVEFIGRVDNQVKIRGYRIEPREIEACILQNEAIKEAVVVAREDSNGDKYLCAYFTANSEMTTASLRLKLSTLLPDYMIPSYFIQLEQMPHTPNGKIERKKLPIFEGQISTANEYSPPETETELKLVDLWKEMLGVERVGINDNFFDLGGHSLKAARFIGKVKKEFGIEIPFREMFQQPTILNIAKIIDLSIVKEKSQIPLVEEAEFYPVPQAIREVLKHSRSRNTSTLYNKTLVTIIEGDLDKNQLEKAFHTLIHRHEILRTSFEFTDGIPLQKVHHVIDFTISEIDITDRDIEKAISEFVRPFQPNQAPLIRVGLGEIKPKKYVLILDMHQVTTDGTSGNILIEEMISLYMGIELEEPSIQYKDYSVWLAEQSSTKEMKEKESYWLNTFADGVPIFNFPTDFERPAIQSLEGSRLKFELDNELVKELKQFSKINGVTLFTTLFSGYNILMHKYSKQEDLVVGTSVAARPHSDLQKMIGSFTNSLAIRSYPKEEMSIREFLENVQENMLNAFENQDYRYGDLVDSLGLREDLSRHPLYDTMFVLHNMEIREVEVGDMKFSPYEQEKCSVKYDFIWHVHEIRDEINIDLMYSTKLFKKETIQKLAEDFICLLKQIIENPEVKIKEVSNIGTLEEVKLK